MRHPDNPFFPRVEETRMKIILSKTPNHLQWPQRATLSVAEAQALLAREMAARNVLPPRERDSGFKAEVVRDRDRSDAQRSQRETR